MPCAGRVCRRALDTAALRRLAPPPRTRPEACLCSCPGLHNIAKMWLDEADGFAEIFKGYLPFYLLVALPIFIIMSPVKPVAASHEFSVYRMQQYDLHTVPHGCRSASFNLEGRSLSSWSTSRHCVVARVQDITIDQYMEIRNKAGALLLVLPKNDTVLSNEEKEHIELLEMAMSQQDVSAPVYFARWTPEFEDIIGDLQHSFITDDKSGTALEAMFNSLESKPVTLHGKLAGRSAAAQTIVIAAHYDASGIVPVMVSASAPTKLESKPVTLHVVSASAPTKLESKPVTLHGKLAGRSAAAQTIVIAAHYDASGIVPLARIFSRLYSSAAVRGGASLIFALTSTGHSLNYFAAKKWLEEHMHVSKPPRPGGAPHSLQTRLGARLTHKKINLADEALAWQHERFNSFKNLVYNIGTIARALASHIYNITDEGSEEDAALYNDALELRELWKGHFRGTQKSLSVRTPSTNENRSSL
ncbi:putative Nicalin, partial [Operophtera brumata]